MRLYDFSIYAAKRKEQLAAQKVVEVVAHLEQPGAVIELKREVCNWMELHREILIKIACS